MTGLGGAAQDPPSRDAVDDALALALRGAPSARQWTLVAQLARELAEREWAKLVPSYNGPHRTFTGVDLAVGKTARHDETVLFTIALLPGGRRRVLAIEAGRWTGPEIVGRISEARVKYNSTVRVESNGAQRYIVQFLAGGFVHVEAHNTGRNRYDPTRVNVYDCFRAALHP